MANIAEVVVIVNDLHKKLRQRQIPVAIADIRSVISKSTETKIEILGPNDWPEKSALFGMLLRYTEQSPKSAIVLINKPKLSTCWRRFVASKEMSHLLIDKEAQFTTDPIAVIDSFLTTMPPEKMDEAIKSERWAFFAALETLVPWGDRSKIIQMIQSGMSNLEIAKKYMVPERIIEYWRRTGYQDLMTRAWADTEISWNMTDSK